MSLIVMCPKHHFSLVKLRQHIRVMVIYLFLRLASTTKNALRVNLKFASPLFIKVVNDLSNFLVKKVCLVLVVLALPRSSLQGAMIKTSLQCQRHNVSLLSSL